MTVDAYARSALAHGHFREAIRYYRQLAASEPEAIWQPGLAEAYRGRALELTAKGMLREAAAIWENRRLAHPGAPGDLEEIRLALALNQAQAAITAYATLAEDAERAEAAYLLAPRCLIDAELLEQLDTDDPLREDAHTALEALEAYCAGADGDAETQLRSIPYRSPFRDWATILRALLNHPSDPQASRALIDRVPPESPFQPIATATALALEPEPVFIEALVDADPLTRRFATTLRGWPPERIALWEDLYADGTSPSIHQLLAVIHAYRTSLGTQWVRHQALRLIFAQLPAETDTRLHSVLGPVEEALLGAWKTEWQQPDDPSAILEGWHRVIRALSGEAKPKPESETALRIAAIQRYLATELRLLETEWAEEVLNGLAESLRLDPDYRPGHLALAQAYRQAGQTAAAMDVLDHALNRWPEAADLLHEALTTAQDAAAYERAAQLAAAILEQDPLNRRAQTARFDALLAHARRCLTHGDSTSAEAALIRARESAQSTAQSERIDRLEALLRYRQQGRRGQRALRAYAAPRATPSAALALAMEACQLDLDPSDLLRAARLHGSGRWSAEELETFCTELESLTPGERDVTALLAPFERTLRRTFRQGDLPRSAYVRCCEALRALGHAPLREACAEAALRHRLEDPYFTFQQLEARLQSSTRPVTGRERDRLRRAIRKARDEGDPRTIHRLEALHRRVNRSD